MDLTGQRVGRLLVIRQLPTTIVDSRTAAWWEVTCDCGVTKPIRQSQLRGIKPTLSCGCLYTESRPNCYKPRLPPGEHAFNSLLGSYKQRSKYKNLEFHLSKEEFRALTNGDCHCCGIAPMKEFKPDFTGFAVDRNKIRTKRYNGGYIFNGIDRVDSSVGYIVSNCVSCCERCNKSKLDISLTEFQAWIDRLIKYQLSIKNKDKYEG